MNRETKRFTEYAPGRTMGQDEKSNVFDWDFPERELSYQELSGYGTPSDYRRFSGSDSPLSQRKLLAWLNAPSSEGVTGRRPQERPFHTGLSWRNYGASPGRTIDPVTVGSSPEENFSYSGLSRYADAAFSYNRGEPYPNFDAEHWEQAFLPKTGKRMDLLSHFGMPDPDTVAHRVATDMDDFPDYEYYYDTKSQAWKQFLPPSYLVAPRYLPPEETKSQDLPVYAGIFKNYLNHSGPTDFVELPVPYVQEGEADFTEALQPNDTQARSLARHSWKQYMYKEAPEAYKALEYAKSKGQKTAWIPTPYLEQHGIRPLSPYVWQKDIYDQAMQNSDHEQLWSDLTGLKEFKWDMPSLFDGWMHSDRKYEPFWAKEPEESQKSITFDDVTKQVNKLCLEDKDNLFLMAPLDSINKAWRSQLSDPKTQCYDVCVDIAKNLGQAQTGNSERIIPFTYQRNQTGKHYYYGDKAESYKKVISVIDRHLLNKRAVIMGLDYRFDGRNPDGTDHFVLLVGKGYDPEKKQYYYLYADPGRTALQGGVSEENRIYLDDKRCILSGKKTGRTRTDWSNNYVLTHVRPNDGKDEETENIYNILEVLSKQSHKDKQPFNYEKDDPRYNRNYDSDNFYNKLSK